MKITTSKILPSINELSETLKQKFSGRYSYELFDFGNKQSIFVEKSAFVSIQVTKEENEIVIERMTKPSVLTTIFFLLDLITTGSGNLLHRLLPFYSEQRKLEQELSTFLKQEYN
ncbi:MULTISPECIES: hypothetical protein [unclassified Chitinophaga]|uniref:hypothetical protein n=1 Tax=unclassified Chitinophaga TaxID=2619133 RepID=UPI003010095F